MPLPGVPPGGAAPRGAQTPAGASAQGRCPGWPQQAKPGWGWRPACPGSGSPRAPSGRGAVRPRASRLTSLGRRPLLREREASADALEGPREGKDPQTPRAKADSRPGLPTCRQPLRCAKFKLCLRERGWRRWGEEGRARPAGPPGPASKYPPPGPRSPPDMDGLARGPRRTAAAALAAPRRAAASRRRPPRQAQGGGGLPSPGPPAAPAPGPPRRAPPPAGGAGKWSPTAGGGAARSGWGNRGRGRTALWEM